MPDISTATGAEGLALPADGLWDKALDVIDGHVMRHLRNARLSPDQVALTVTESEQLDRPGRPALRVAMGEGDVTCSTFIDWNGTLSWNRPRTWLDRKISREIARRRWIMAMVGQGVSPETAPFDHRSVHPLLRGIVRTGCLTMDMLVARHGGRRSMRYGLGDAATTYRRRRSWHTRVEVDVPDMPAADIRIDHDRVDVCRMALSQDVHYHGGEDAESVVRLGRHRLPRTALATLCGRPLSDLVDSPLLSQDAMPIIDRMRTRPNGSQEAVLRRDVAGMPCVMGQTVRHVLPTRKTTI